VAAFAEAIAEQESAQEHWVEFMISAKRTHRNFMEYKRRLGNRPHDPELFWQVIELQMNRWRWRRMGALLTLVVAWVAVICQ
jgi:hypothetical protein